MRGMEEATATASVTRGASGSGNMASASGVVRGGKTTGTAVGSRSSITGAPMHRRHDHAHVHKRGLQRL